MNSKQQIEHSIIVLFSKLLCTPLDFLWPFAGSIINFFEGGWVGLGGRAGGQSKLTKLLSNSANRNKIKNKSKDSQRNLKAKHLHKALLKF